MTFEMYKTKLRKVSRSTITTVPAALMKMLGLNPGDEVEWSLSGKKMVVTPVKKESKLEDAE